MLDEQDFRVRLAVINELQGLGVPIPRRDTPKKPSKNKNASGTFGVPLAQVVEQHGIEWNGLRIPKLLHDIAEHLRPQYSTVGLFRVCGSAVRMRKIEETANRGETIGAGQPHDLAGILKSFFRLLPDPLLTHRLYGAFVDAFQLPAPERLRAVLLLCLELPQAHLHTLRFLMNLLSDVVSQPDTKMTANNLAAIFTPNLLSPLDIDSKTKERATVTTELELGNHKNAVGVVELLILHHDLIGVVPPDVEAAAAGLEAKQSKARYQKALAKKGFCGCFGGSADAAASSSTAAASEMATPARTPGSEEPRRRGMNHLTSKATLELLHGTPDRK